MATENTMCSLKRSTVHLDTGKPQRKTARIPCPICGRRLVCRSIVDEDDILVGYSMPPHKRKKWWKVPKK